MSKSVPRLTCGWGGVNDQTAPGSRAASERLRRPENTRISGGLDARSRSKESLAKWLRELDRSGVESPYLERLRGRLDPEAALADLQAEILREQAAALGRAEDKVNLALLELDVLGRRIDALAATDPAGPALLAAFAEGRVRAERARWELQVHREALGLRQNAILRELYPIPPARR